MPVNIALLRAVNVGGYNRVPMPQLRKICMELGWSGVRSYIQSGNVVFTTSSDTRRAEGALEAALLEQLGLTIPVLVRRATAWSAMMAGNPLPEASAEEGNLVMAGLAKCPPASGALDIISERAAVGEQIARVGDTLWFHFGNGSAKSRVTPALIDRAAGSPVTLRNWRTLVKLDEMMREAP